MTAARPALADIVVKPDNLVITLSGEPAERIVGRGYGSFSGQANVACRRDQASDKVVCVVELVDKDR